MLISSKYLFVVIEDPFDKGNKDGIVTTLQRLKENEISSILATLLLKGRLDIVQWLSQFKKHAFWNVLKHMIESFEQMKTKKQLLTVLQQLFQTGTDKGWMEKDCTEFKLPMFTVYKNVLLNMCYFCYCNCLDVAQWLWSMIDCFELRKIRDKSFECTIIHRIEIICRKGLTKMTRWFFQTVVPDLIRKADFFSSLTALNEMYEKAFESACCAPRGNVAIWLHTVYGMQNVTTGFLSACFYGNSSTVQYLLPICSAIAIHTLPNLFLKRGIQFWGDDTVYDYFKRCCFNKNQIRKDWNSVIQMGFEIAVCRGHLETVVCFEPFLTNLVTTQFKFLNSWVDWRGIFTIYRYKPAVRDWLVQHGIAEDWYDIFLSQKEPPPVDQKRAWIKMAIRRHCENVEKGEKGKKGEEGEKGKWWETCKSWWVTSEPPETKSAKEFWDIATFWCLSWSEKKSKYFLQPVWEECMRHFTFDPDCAYPCHVVNTHLFASLLCRFRPIWYVLVQNASLPRFLEDRFYWCKISDR